jgi:hypothetical protein
MLQVEPDGMVTVIPDATVTGPAVTAFFPAVILYDVLTV